MLSLSRLLYSGCQNRCGLEVVAFCFNKIPSPLTNTPCLLPHTKSVVPRSLHTATPNFQNNPHKGGVKIFHIPTNPFKWLHNRMLVSTLKNSWDPSFDIETFKFGAAQAICTVSELIGKREWGELNGLLTQSLIDEFRTTTRHMLMISPDNIQVVTITEVNLDTIVDRKYCDIDVTVIAAMIQKQSPTVLEYRARFHREYTDYKLPEWTIIKFILKDPKEYTK